MSHRGRGQKAKPKQSKAKRRAEKRAQAKALAEAARRERYEKRLQTRLDRLERVGRALIDFFAPLGISVDLQVRMTDDLYLVGGKPLGSGGESQKNWDPEIDRFVAQERDLAQRFVASIRENAAPLWPGSRAYYVPRDHGFTLAWPDAEVGFVLVCPTHARIFFDGPTLTANYLTRGQHWSGLKAAIDAHDVERRLSPLGPNRESSRAVSHRSVRVPLRALTGVPEGTPRDLERATLDASRRLRRERQMVYATPAALEAEFAHIRFEPIESNAGELLVPFRLRCDSSEVQGGIFLSGDHDPVRIEIYYDDVADDPFVWSTAIRGYADLTTWNFIDVARHVTTRHGQVSIVSRTGGRRVGATTRAQERRLPRSRPRNTRLSWPDYLRPIGDTAANLAAHVAGHRRRLAPGWTPSAEARERARQLGISLASEETWVRPHVRGGPPGYVLRFEWQP
jgi:hypothetical protein